MPDFPSGSPQLAPDFPPVSAAEWEAAARADLAGAEFEKKLMWRTAEGILVRPWYRAEDTEGLPGLEGIAFESPKPAVVIDAARLGDSGATTVQELGYGLAALWEAVAGDHPEAGAGLIFSAGTNFFFEIAKLRAARLLWHEATGQALFIEVRTTLSDKSLYDPYANLLRATTEAMSALIGGANSLLVQPFGFPSRLAANVDHILREEAKLDEVVDPVAGSWYLEVLTRSVADEARKLMEETLRSGGFQANEQQIAAAIERARNAQEAAVAQRRRVLVGVNDYPDLSEVRDCSELPLEAGQAWRAPASFESVRLRTDAHAKRTGRRPLVLLLTRGDLKMRRARAQFCRNLFGCGGFAIAESAEPDVSADLIILCSSDAEYPSLAAETCRLVHQPVLVAGNPGAYLQALDEAGVAGYVHAESNALETLRCWQQRLGIAERQG